MSQLSQWLNPRSSAAKMAVLFVVISVVYYAGGHYTMPWLAFVPSMVAHGFELWRLITYSAIFLASPMSFIFGVLILVSIGGALERMWGAKRLWIFSFTISTVAALLTLALAFFVPVLDQIPFTGADAIVDSLWVAYGLSLGSSRSNFWGLPVTGNTLALIGASFVLLTGLLGSWLIIVPSLFALGLTFVHVRYGFPRRSLGALHVVALEPRSRKALESPARHRRRRPQHAARLGQVPALMTRERRTALIAAVAVVAVSVLARLLVSTFSLYLEPWAVTKQAHLWQLATWTFAGASLTFIVHAALLGFALSRGVKVSLWLGSMFIVGALVSLLAFLVPAVASCTFTGAGVSATVCLWAASRTLTGRPRWAFIALALVPALLDGLVDGAYVLLPFGFALPTVSGWVRLSRRRT